MQRTLEDVISQKEALVEQLDQKTKEADQLKEKVETRNKKLKRMIEDEKLTENIRSNGIRSISENSSRKNSGKLALRKKSSMIDKYQYEHLKKQFDKLAVMNKELRKKNQFLSENLKEEQKINKAFKNQLSIYINELRKTSSLNLDMKRKLDTLFTENENLISMNKNLEISNENLEKEKNDFLKQIKKILEKEKQHQKFIEELEKKVVKPDELAYVYNIKKKTLFSEEKIQLILKKRVNGKYVFEIETVNKEKFSIGFKDVIGFDWKENGKELVIRCKRQFRKEMRFVIGENSRLQKDLDIFWQNYQTLSRS